MAIEFDHAKDAINIAVHGISLKAAEALLQGLTVEWNDRRRDYGETRMIAIGEIGERVFVCVYTPRGPIDRIISPRPASRKERHIQVVHQFDCNRQRGS
ncbi:MAG: BrnT family toxin [Alphaproteobacteria bacterium]